MKLATVKEKVLWWLQNNERCRESDEYLIACIWYNECGNTKLITAFHFLGQFTQGKFSSPESIRRSRQKYQELMPELRGKNYKVKQDEQANVKQELKEFI